jgi:hypothetical protein
VTPQRFIVERYVPAVRTTYREQLRAAAILSAIAGLFFRTELIPPHRNAQAARRKVCAPTLSKFSSFSSIQARWRMER